MGRAIQFSDLQSATVSFFSYLFSRVLHLPHLHFYSYVYLSLLPTLLSYSFFFGFQIPVYITSSAHSWLGAILFVFEIATELNRLTRHPISPLIIHHIMVFEHLHPIILPPVSFIEITLPLLNLWVMFALPSRKGLILLPLSNYTSSFFPLYWQWDT